MNEKSKVYHIPTNQIMVVRLKDIHNDIIVCELPDKQYDRVKAAYEAINKGDSGASDKFIHMYENFIPLKDIYLFGDINEILEFTDRHIGDVLDIYNNAYWINKNFKYPDCTVCGIKENATSNPRTAIKYMHCRLGKPKYMIAFKVPTTKVSIFTNVNLIERDERKNQETKN